MGVRNSLGIAIGVLLWAIPASACARDIFADFDTVMAMTVRWNAAIDQHTPERLLGLYASEVEMYGRRQSAEAVVDGKRKWLEANVKYRQLVEAEEMECTFGEDVSDRIEVRFEKVTVTKGVEKAYIGILGFQFIENRWQIVKESDETTELNLAKKATGVDLSDGEYCFEWEQFEDGRGMGLADSIVRRTYSARFTLAKGKLAAHGTMSTYSGALRSIWEFEIVGYSALPDKTIALTTQALNLHTGELDDPQTATWKLLANRELVVLSGETPWEPGIRLKYLPCE